MRRSAPLPAIVALALLAGCGSSSSKTSSAPSSTPTSGSASATSTPAAAAPARAGKPVMVKMKDIAFVPKAVTVRVGQTVKWVNQDSVVHNVTAENGGGFHSSDFASGGSFSYTPRQAGTISYVCTIHPNMTATLTVTS